MNAQSALAQEFDTYKKSVTIEKLTESIQLTFNQELNDLRQSLTDLVSKVENLPEVFKQILDPITQVSHEVSSGQLNLAGSIQGQIEGQYFISIETAEILNSAQRRCLRWPYNHKFSE